MGYYYDEFYNEPNEFEKQVEEFKDCLREVVKKEFKDEMERLRKENLELQEFKSRKEQIEAEHQKTLREVKMGKEDFERKLKKMRIAELLGEHMLMGWFATCHKVEKPKCDNCDSKRKIQYTTPSGRKAEETCSICGSPDYFYEPEEIECYRFSEKKDSWGRDERPVSRYYQRDEGKDWDDFERCREVYNGEQFEDIKRSDIVFFKQEECQQYCDWKNSKVR